MKYRLQQLLVAAIFASAVGVIAAHSQNATLGAPVAVVPVQSLGQSDLVPLARQGVGQVPTQFASPGLLGGTLAEQVSVPLTGFSLTPNNNTTLLFLNPAGTLATGTITFPANPGDAQAFCWISSQTQTGVTMTANTGQSLVGTAVTAGVAGTEYCWRYISLTATWYRYL